MADSKSRTAGVVAWMMLTGAAVAPTVADAQTRTPTEETALDEAPLGEVEEGSGDDMPEVQERRREQAMKHQHQARDREMHRKR